METKRAWFNLEFFDPLFDRNLAFIAVFHVNWDLILIENSLIKLLPRLIRA